MLRTLNIFCIVLVSTGLFSCKTSQMDRNLEQDKSILTEQLNEMVNEDQKYRNLLEELRKKELSKAVYKKKYDSLWTLQKEIDKDNIEKMIGIIKKYGFPNPDRLGAPIATWVILQHTPQEYTKAVKILAKKEYKAGRLYPMEYEMISWHLNGREGLPFGLERADEKDQKNNK